MKYIQFLPKYPKFKFEGKYKHLIQSNVNVILMDSEIKL